PPIALHNSSSWTYTGPFLPPTSLPSSFHTWHSQTISGSLLPTLTPLLHLISSFLSSANLTHYCLTIRAARACDDFNTPRWHVDDQFFNPSSTPTAKGYWKLCATLQGPGTLFLTNGAQARKTLKAVTAAARKAAPRHTCSAVRCVACGLTSEAVRADLAWEMRGAEVRQSSLGEAVFFRIGGREGAVHSEPPICGDRIFVNVVPGTERELRDLMGRWGVGYPRAWSWGVPGAIGVGEEE
ncbi:hypothetical protein EJ06DRAFT_459295, partial [Trichodelitschia bisporula]